MASSGAGRDAILQANTDARRLSRQALSLDKDGKTDQAITLYQECCRVLLVGMGVDIRAVARDAEDVASLQSIQEKLSSLFEYASSRLQNLEAVVPTPMYTFDASESASQSLPRRTEADMVFALPSGVRMLQTLPTGEVKEHQGVPSLRIYLIPATDDIIPTGAPAFLQCDTWVYPLIPGCSPIFRSSPHSYTFPDVNKSVNPFGVQSTAGPGNGAQGSYFVTIVLDQSVDRSVVTQLGQTLETLANVQDHAGVAAVSDQAARQQQQKPEKPAASNMTTVSAAGSRTASSESRGAAAAGSNLVPYTGASGTVAKQSDTGSISGRISAGISAGAGIASTVLNVTAQFAGKAVQAGSAELRQRMTTREDMEISQSAKTAAKGAKLASEAAVVVSEQVVAAVAGMAKVISDHVVPIAMDKLSTKDDGRPRDPATQAKIQGAVEIGSASIDGFLTIYRTLEKAARHVGGSLQKATVETVSHRYGDSAGGVTDEAVGAVGNIVVASHNFDDLGIKALAKKTAVQAGKTGLKSLDRSAKPPDDPK